MSLILITQTHDYLQWVLLYNVPVDHENMTHLYIPQLQLIFEKVPSKIPSRTLNINKCFIKVIVYREISKQ